MDCPACTTDVPDGSAFCGACGTVVDATSAKTQSNAQTAAFSRGVSSSASALDESRFLPGTMIAGRYRIIGLLGRGGMGEVYRADDLKLGQAVALKFLSAELAGDQARLDRLLQEVKIARQVSHPNVCRVYDVGEAEGHHYLSMEYVDGEDLATLLRRIGRLPNDKALQIARQLCAGLAAAHGQGILHRDLKPANVMLDGQGRVRLTDFGLAGLADSIAGADIRSGTPTYMAPEQLAGKEVTVRSDVYALALVIYELFTGKKASERESSTWSTVEGIDPTVERVLLRCLEENPNDRPDSALSVAAALPGGDPLAAALAAGETPSPEMVAAAGPAGGLRPGIALACLVSLLVGIVVTLPTAGIFLHERLPFDRSFVALQENAREIAAELGYTDTPSDTASWFAWDMPRYIEIVTSKGVGALIETVDEQGHTLAHFIHRRGNGPIAPLALNGGVRWNDPPVGTGEVGIWLDLRGNLVRLRARPQNSDSAEEHTGETDWTGLFEAAGLDLAEFSPTEPSRVPQTFADERAAWTGLIAGDEKRIEAAAFEGKPVFFRVFPADAEDSSTQPPAGLLIAAIVILLVVFLLIAGGALFLAIRNLRLGRGDRRGAFRLAVLVFALDMIDWTLTGDHVGHPAYVAIEPYVRRLWPEAIVSWTRLISGRFRDPLVGRDVLLGCTASVVFGVPISWALWAIGRAGMLGPLPSNSLTALKGGRFAIGSVFGVLLASLAIALGLMMFVLLLRMILRKTWIAMLVTAIILAVASGFQFTIFASPEAALFVAILNAMSLVLGLGLLVRFGLLSMVAYMFTSLVLQSAPIPLDTSSPHFGTGLFLMLIVVGIAAYAFKLSLAGRSLMRDPILER